MEPPDTDPWAPLFTRLHTLKDAWPGPAWKWDGRLGAIESAFAQAAFAAARSCAAGLLPQEWTAATIGQAPPALRELSARTGSMRPGQLFLAGEAVNGVGAYGLWWPWGNGATVTLRIGLSGVAPTVEPFPRFRQLFGVGA